MLLRDDLFYFCDIRWAMVQTSEEKDGDEKNKVLAQLQKNSTQNIDSIAKHCGFSAQKTRRIITQLEKNQYIWGYTAVVDEEKNNLSHFILLIKKTPEPLDKKVTNKIESMKIEDFVSNLDVTIESSCLVHGTYDWVISFIAPDIKEAKKFCDALMNEFPRIIKDADLLQTLYFVRRHQIFNPNRKKLSDIM